MCSVYDSLLLHPVRVYSYADVVCTSSCTKFDFAAISGANVICDPIPHVILI